ncbi:MAG: AsmA family protein, partial [bacterium]
MLRLFKFLLAAVFTLATVVIVGIIWLLVAVDPNEYKPQIEQLAADNDIRLEIGGDIHWRIWPSLAIELTDTRIAIPQQGIDRLDFRNGALIVDTRQLLQRNVVFRGLSIDGAIIEARTLEDAGKIVAAPALANGADNSDTSRPFSMKVEQIKLNDSSIRFQSGDTLYSLERLSFLIDGFDIGKPFDLSLSAESTTAEGTPVSL